MNAPWHVCILIPARDEEELLPRCLASIEAARQILPSNVTTDLIVAVDSSVDGTLEIARHNTRPDDLIFSTGLGVVGGVRRMAARLALERYGGNPERCWLANTDADCVVPKTWLLDQWKLAATGVEAVAGTIDVDCFAEHEPIVEGRFRATYLIRPDRSLTHVHAANVGIRADAYLRAGGWNEMATGEDGDLWRRLCEIKAKRIATSRIEVLTSGRRIGRAPNGFAEALAAHNENAA